MVGVDPSCLHLEDPLVFVEVENWVVGVLLSAFCQRQCVLRVIFRVDDEVPRQPLSTRSAERSFKAEQFLFVTSLKVRE